MDSGLFSSSGLALRWSRFRRNKLPQTSFRSFFVIWFGTALITIQKKQTTTNVLPVFFRHLVWHCVDHYSEETTSDILNPSEMRRAHFWRLKDSITVARHSGFVFLMRIRNKKTGIHRSRAGARIALWIPVFFGRIHTSIQSMMITPGLYVSPVMVMHPPEKTGMTVVVFAPGLRVYGAMRDSENTP